ncbi:MAG: STAS domain-containing protein [Burkholderiales bacterium]|jgi:anti-anti-sigma factor|nr:STAS domain-containing protein [Burkholderiales bacterium]
MTTENLANNVVRSILAGKLDLAGAQKIDLKFSAIAGNSKRLLVDLEQVSFLASMGIRTLVIGSKAVQSKGGKMAFFKPSADVAQVLTAAGIDSIIPVFQDLDAACDYLTR